MQKTDFPLGTEFYIKDFDVPLARIPDIGWVDFYGGEVRSYEVKNLSIDNNLPANSFEDWRELVRKPISAPDHPV